MGSRSQLSSVASSVSSPATREASLKGTTLSKRSSSSSATPIPASDSSTKSTSSSGSASAKVRPSILKRPSKVGSLLQQSQTHLLSPRRRVSFSFDSKNKATAHCPLSTRSLDSSTPVRRTALSFILPEKIRNDICAARLSKETNADTLVHEHVQNLDFNALQKALESRTVDINARNLSEGATALILAVKHANEAGTLALARLLLHHGASVHPLDKNGHSCLHWAAAYGREDMLNLLCSYGAPAEVQSSAGETPLHRAARFGQVNCVKLLMYEFEASAALCNKKQQTAYDVAGIYNRKTNAAHRMEVQTLMLRLQPSLRSLILSHPDCMLHDTSAGHQESASRITEILKAIRTKAAEGLNIAIESTSDFRMASIESIKKVHDESYVNLLQELNEQVQRLDAPVPLTPRLQIGLHGANDSNAKAPEHCDTAFSKGTLNAALRAAGAVCHAIDRVVDKKNMNAFCVVRPPGHHAGTYGLLTDSTSCGFCIFNSVVIGAKHALSKHALIQKVAIIDIDAHHGNGTEEILKRLDLPDHLFFASLHLFDTNYYPGTGKKDDLEYNVINAALTPCWQHGTVNQMGSRGFRHQFSSRVLPALRAFNPDLILVSAGFDGGKHDIGNKECGQRRGRIGLDLLPQDYYWITERLKAVAAICCEGRLISVLEGGYGRVDTSAAKDSRELVLDTLAESALAHVCALSGQALPKKDPPIKKKSKGPVHKYASDSSVELTRQTKRNPEDFIRQTRSRKRSSSDRDDDGDISSASQSPSKQRARRRTSLQ